eukprot:m.438629 g.438629  ORF g.438629 m.438629 type:complete len:295 (-) comp20276_c1_seq4:207-1091(-)
MICVVGSAANLRIDFLFPSNSSLRLSPISPGKNGRKARSAIPITIRFIEEGEIETGEEGHNPTRKAEKEKLQPGCPANKFLGAVLMQVLRYDPPQRNPMGPTGAVGQGTFPRKGGNDETYFIICRWKRMELGSEMVRGNHKVLEYVAVQKQFERLGGPYTSQDGAQLSGDRQWTLPGGPSETCGDLNYVLRELFGAQSHQGQVIQVEEPRVIYDGYLDDPRNTDNAWVHAQVNLFLDNDRILDDHQLQLQLGTADLYQDVWDIAWMPLHKHQSIRFRDFHALLAVEAQRLGAFW